MSKRSLQDTALRIYLPKALADEARQLAMVRAQSLAALFRDLLRDRLAADRRKGARLLRTSSEGDSSCLGLS